MIKITNNFKQNFDNNYKEVHIGASFILEFKYN